MKEKIKHQNNTLVETGALENPKIIENIHNEMKKVIVGYEDVINDMVAVMLARGHVLLEGAPGVAKTTLAKAFTHIMGLKFNRIQFTPDMLPQDITGHYYYNQKTGEFEIRKGPIFTNLLLADEINRATPKTQSALLEAMEERQVTIEGTTLVLPTPFMVIATTNPLEVDGVYNLPVAQADRFTFKIKMNYLKSDREIDILRLKANGNSHTIDSMRVLCMHDLEKAYKKVHVDDSILTYIRDIIIETRNSPEITIGASPRAGEHMLYVSKAVACIEGRDYVIPDDVKHVTLNILNHRILLSPESDMEDASIEQIIDDIIKKVKVPVKKG